MQLARRFVEEMKTSSKLLGELRGQRAHLKREKASAVEEGRRSAERAQELRAEMRRLEIAALQAEN